jgi:polar amino acid transport system permease protein
MTTPSSEVTTLNKNSLEKRNQGLMPLLFSMPWWLLIMGLVLVWLIYLILVGTNPVVLSRPADPNYESIRDFEGLEEVSFAVGVIEGANERTTALRYVTEDRLREYPSFDAALTALQADEIGGIMVDSFFGQNYARSNGDLVELHTDNFFADTFTQISEGLPLTLGVVAIGYSTAIAIGLLIGLIRSAPPKPGTNVSSNIVAFVRLIIYQAATLYVAVLRGLPILVTLLVTAFVLMPIARNWLTGLGVELPRQLFLQAGIFALAIAYGAFLSETFRAGIQSIERGQIEAARSLGMSYLQVIRHIVLPQAIRRILPPLGNDMIAMIKDTSLVSALGVNDITQLASLWSATTFRYPEVLFMLAMIYLTMTILGSLVVRWVETKLAIPGR